MLPVVLVLAGVIALFVPYHHKASGEPQRLTHALAEIPRALIDIAAVRRPYTACMMVLFILIGAFAPLMPAIIAVALGQLGAQPPDPHRAAFVVSTLILLFATAACLLLMEFSQMVIGFGSSRSGRRTIWMLIIVLLPAMTSLASAIAILHRGWALAIIRACA